MSVLHMPGDGLDCEAPAASVPKQVHLLDVKLWPGRGDSTIQGSFVIQGLLKTSAGEREFWGDKVILYAISCMWDLKISVLNSRMLQEYCICHDVPFTDADVCMVYNARSHYSAAGTFSHEVSRIADFTVYTPVSKLVTLLGWIVSHHIN